MQPVSPCNFYFLSVYIMTYNTRLNSKRKSSITAPGPLTLKLISKQARLNATKSVLVLLVKMRNLSRNGSGQGIKFGRS